MNKILHITFEAPSRRSGGGLGIVQSLISSTRNGAVDYVGPEYNIDEFPEINIKNYYFLKKENNLFRKLKALLLGVSMGSYYPWQNLKKNLDISQYNVIYIDFSRHDYIVRWAKKNKKPVIVRVHNVEQDYFKRVVFSKGDKKVRTASIIKYLFMKRREKYCMRNADQLLFLTEYDLERADEIYKVQNLREKSHIMPVCLKISDRNNMHTDIKEKYFLITGSLWYGANADGVEWFLNEVWKKASSEFINSKLVIAGARPNDKIKKLCKTVKNCILVDSPMDMSPYFNDAYIYIAPVFDGAGMKVKVAEAMSYGLPVIGTKHAMIGYDNSFFVNKVVNSADECLNAMKELYENDNSFKKEQIKQVFKENYDIKVSEKIVENAILNCRRYYNDNN